MHRTLAILSSLAAVVSALGATGCSSSSSPPAQAGCVSSPVSFSKDIAPTFLLSGCSLTSVCHGQPNNSGEESLFLGASDMSTDPKMIYEGLVGVMAKENPMMPLVTKGDTENSFLWHKIKGDQNSNAAVTAGCTMATVKCSNCSASAPCGAPMPDTAAEALAAGEPDNFCKIQNWIEQGANND